MIGWIDASHDYPIGRPDNEVICRLRTLIKTRTETFDLHVNPVRGIHPCNLCGNDIQLDGKTILGMSEIWIPSNGIWLAAPSLVVHYMEYHSYIPPSVFCSSILELDSSMPVMCQAEYDRLISVASNKGRNLGD